MGMAALTVPRYTVEDLDRFPDDGNRYELLEGMLLVTPGPSEAHQVVAGRLHTRLANAVDPTGLARVVSPGVVVRLPGTQLQPDVLVYPRRLPVGSKWSDITGHWLAVEVLSRSSRVYDRDFKRDAYLALGVLQVWLVDTRTRTLFVSSRAGEMREVSDVLRWSVPGEERLVTIELVEIFAELE
jgi:Uma2 family endonuclease